MAVPRLRGTAISKARKDETRVPYIKGKAPNFLKTGSHVEVKRKLKPNLWIEGREALPMSRAMKSIMRMMDRLNRRDRALKILSAGMEIVLLTMYFHHIRKIYGIQVFLFHSA